MNRTIATALLIAASLLAQAGAFAQGRVQATIPFDFSVEDHLMPAGTYLVKHLSPSTIVLSAWKGKDVVSALAIITPTDNFGNSVNKLIFHHYGARYFLSEIHDRPGCGAGMLRTSKLERRLLLQQAGVADPQSTEVALK